MIADPFEVVEDLGEQDPSLGIARAALDLLDMVRLAFASEAVDIVLEFESLLGHGVIVSGALMPVAIDSRAIALPRFPSPMTAIHSSNMMDHPSHVLNGTRNLDGPFVRLAPPLVREVG